MSATHGLEPVRIREPEVEQDDVDRLLGKMLLGRGQADDVSHGRVVRESAR